ncbi:MAG: hypothetical protein ACUVXA_09060 [Candidatus Jordarchaeum sp.]|uniref:hypothetical protein n=1 Tax=Candidatus Jordarchaeum sp. TaxID=2823881 RepID=UPI00404B7D0E
MIVLYTDILTEIFDKESVKRDKALSKIIESNEDIATTSINLHEILYGLQKYAKPIKDILHNLGEKAPDFSRGDESTKSLSESRVY